MECKAQYLRVIKWLGSKISVLAVITMSIIQSDAFSAEYDLFVSFAGGGSIEDYVASKGFMRLPIVYPRYIDKNQDGRLDTEQYSNHIGNRFKSYAGPIALDWEGRAYRRLIGVKSVKEDVREIVDEYIKSVKLLQSVSTKHVTIGFYGFPSKVSTHNDSTMKEVSNLRKIYERIDILYPSLYLGRQGFSKYTLDFTKKHLRNALQIRCEKKIGKKVYAFITHRFHPNSRFTPNSLIPFDIFEDYIKTIRGVRYRECKIDGIVWWGADQHWYKKGWRKEIVSSINSYSSITDYNDKVIDRYADIIIKYFGE